MPRPTDWYWRPSRIGRCTGESSHAFTIASIIGPRPGARARISPTTEKPRERILVACWKRWCLASACAYFVEAIVSLREIAAAGRPLRVRAPFMAAYILAWGLARAWETG